MRGLAGRREIARFPQFPIADRRSLFLFINKGAVVYSHEFFGRRRTIIQRFLIPRRWKMLDAKDKRRPLVLSFTRFDFILFYLCSLYSIFRYFRTVCNLIIGLIFLGFGFRLISFRRVWFGTRESWREKNEFQWLAAWK